MDGQQSLAAGSITLYPGFLHTLHKLYEVRSHKCIHVSSNFTPVSDAPLQSLEQNGDGPQASRDDLVRKAGSFAARGTVVHIRRASRHTTFVDISLAAEGVRKPGSDQLGLQLGEQKVAVLVHELSASPKPGCLLLGDPNGSCCKKNDAGQTNPDPDSSVADCAYNAESKQSNTNQANPADQANPPNQSNQTHQANQTNQTNQANQANQTSQAHQATEAIQANQANQSNQTNQANEASQSKWVNAAYQGNQTQTTLQCANCSRLELLIPSSVLAPLPQKLRIGSQVECWGDPLENLSVRPAAAKDNERPGESVATGLQLGSQVAAKDSADPRTGAVQQLDTGEHSDGNNRGAGLGEGTESALSKQGTSLSEGCKSQPVHTPFALSGGGMGVDVDWMLRVSGLTVFDPRGSTTGNEFLFKTLAVRGELPSVCRGGRGSGPKPGVCKYWVNEGQCARGADCPYEHPPHGEPLKKARAAYLEAKARVHHSLGNAGKAKRAQVFGDWLRETLGVGLRVMDVAAGAHGELAFHLAEHGIFCTSVEPRERKLTKAQRKALAEKGVRVPRDSSPPLLPESLIGAQRRELFADNEYWTETVRNEADVLVGLHPDQVTEAIVDVALQAGVPFAVVPCCVFPKLFPDRRMPDGRPVITYDDFVEYLQLKGTAHGKSVEKGTLKFAGSNTVLFART